MKQKVVQYISSYITELEQPEIEKLLEIPPKPEMGDFAFPCFRLAKVYRKAPQMIAEDFSFYQKKVPGLFFYTGVRDENHVHNIHHCSFNYDEESLLYAIETNVRLLEKLEAYHD